MREIKEVLRLRFELGLKQREIARACSISQGAVHSYLKKAAAAGVCWPLPEGWDEPHVEQTLFGDQRSIERSRERAHPDFAALHQQLQQHRYLTRQLVWEEYRQGHPEGYSYSRFCDLYRHWRGKQDVVLRQEHPPGEKGFIDWAGATIPVHDAVTGEVWPASLFVMVLGASSYTYAEATRDQQLSAWLSCHMHAFEYFGGVPRLLVPDNLRTGVTRACRYDPDLNPTYQELAMHYGVGVVPARPYRPRDKAKVEVGVQVVERWIIAALRHRKFFRLEEVNGAVRELLERLNQRPFRKREGSRASVFATLERSALRPLPAERFDLSQWSRARVNIDYHIAFEGNFYSVPYTLVQEPVEVRSTPATVEIFHQGQRVASHLRSHTRGQAIHARGRPLQMRSVTFRTVLVLGDDQQWNWRENQALTRRVKASRLRGGACVEDINYRAERGLNKSVIRALAQQSLWVKNHEHIFVLGPTGVGKSYLASALAQKACRDGYAVYYTPAAALFRNLNLARADGSLGQLLKRLNRIDVLVIDDWAMAPLAESERRDFWEIAEDRYQTRSLILTSQLPVSRWHEQIGDPTLADGILDRLVHNAHRIEMRGESMRKTPGEKGEK